MSASYQHIFFQDCVKDTTENTHEISFFFKHISSIAIKAKSNLFHPTWRELTNLKKIIEVIANRLCSENRYHNRLLTDI